MINNKCLLVFLEVDAFVDNYCAIAKPLGKIICLHLGWTQRQVFIWKELGDSCSFPPLPDIQRKNLNEFCISAGKLNFKLKLKEFSAKKNLVIIRGSAAFCSLEIV